MCFRGSRTCTGPQSRGARAQLRIRVIRFFRRVSQHVRKLSSVGAAPYCEGDTYPGSGGDPEKGGECAPPVKGSAKASPRLSTVHEHKDGSSGMVSAVKRNTLWGCMRVTRAEFVSCWQGKQEAPTRLQKYCTSSIPPRRALPDIRHAPQAARTSKLRSPRIGHVSPSELHRSPGTSSVCFRPPSGASGLESGSPFLSTAGNDSSPFAADAQALGAPLLGCDHMVL